MTLLQSNSPWFDSSVPETRDTRFVPRRFHFAVALAILTTQVDDIMLVDPVATELDDESLDDWGHDPPSVGYGDPDDDGKDASANQRVS